MDTTPDPLTQIALVHHVPSEPSARVYAAMIPGADGEDCQLAYLDASVSEGQLHGNGILPVLDVRSSHD